MDGGITSAPAKLTGGKWCCGLGSVLCAVACVGRDSAVTGVLCVSLSS